MKGNKPPEPERKTGFPVVRVNVSRFPERYLVVLVAL